MIKPEEIQIQTINHLGLIAGIIDEIGIEEILNNEQDKSVFGKIAYLIRLMSEFFDSINNSTYFPIFSVNLAIFSQ